MSRSVPRSRPPPMFATALVAALGLACVDASEGTAVSGFDTGMDTDATGADTSSDTNDTAPPTCDPGAVELRTPVWVEPLAGDDEPTEIAGPVATSADAVFLAGYRVDAETHFVERRTLDGEVLWRVERESLLSSRDSLAWDGLHLYFFDGSSIRRMDGDGVVDPRWVASSLYGDGIAHNGVGPMNVEGPDVVFDNHANTQDPPDGVAEAWRWIAGQAKDGPDEFEVHPPGDTGASAFARTSDGYLAALARTPIQLIGIEGASFDAYIDSESDRPHADHLVASPENVLVIGGNGSSSTGSTTWTRTLDWDGAELSRHAINPCGVGVSIEGFAYATGLDRVWGVVYLGDDPGMRTLLVEIDLDGALIRASRLAGIDDLATLNDIAVNEAGVVAVTIHGWGGADSGGWIARVQ